MLCLKVDQLGVFLDLKLVRRPWGVVETMIMMTGALRYSANPGAGGEWDVVDQDRNDETVARCSDAHGAKLIAALMNGDVSQLASARSIMKSVGTFAYLRTRKPPRRPISS